MSLNYVTCILLLISESVSLVQNFDVTGAKTENSILPLAREQGSHAFHPMHDDMTRLCKLLIKRLRAGYYRRQSDLCIHIKRQLDRWLSE